MKKILLTGATGFVGTNFVLQLHHKYDIIALVRIFSDTSKIEKYCKIYRYDNTIESVQKVFESEKIDGVVHLATTFLNNHSLKNIKEIMEANISFGAYILEVMRESEIENIFFINVLTFAQFSNSPTYNPANFYAATKKAFYDISKYYSNTLPTCFTHLLLYDTYGLNDTRTKIFNLWKKIAQNGETLEMSKGEQKIDISHVDDVVNGFDILIQLCLDNKIKNNQIYTLENKRYTLKELASLFEKYSGLKLNIKWGAKPYRENEIFNPISAKDSKELKKLPNYKPKISLEEGIKMLISDNALSNGGGVI